MDISETLRKPWVIPAVVGITAAAVGFTAGYICGVKKNSLTDVIESVESHSDSVDERIDEYTPRVSLNARDFEEGFEEDDNEVEVDDISEPHKISLHDYQTILAQEGYSDEVAFDPDEDEDEDIYNPEDEYGTEETEIDFGSPLTTDEEEDEAAQQTFEHRNIFEGAMTEWNYEEEDENRSSDAPYILHTDEFARNDKGYRQETLTYFVDDDTLVDNDDNIIDGYQGLMGDLRFGHGSLDPNVCYIRNEQIRMEWQILLHAGTYSDARLQDSLTAQYESSDLKHSADRRFREEY